MGFPSLTILPLAGKVVGLIEIIVSILLIGLPPLTIFCHLAGPGSTFLYCLWVNYLSPHICITISIYLLVFHLSSYNHLEIMQWP